MINFDDRDVSWKQQLKIRRDKLKKEVEELRKKEQELRELEKAIETFEPTPLPRCSCHGEGCMYCRRGGPGDR